MAKFCNKCGKELVDGKCPNCSNAEEKVNETEVAEEAAINMEDVKNKVKNLKKSPIVQKIVSYYKGAVISPIKVVKDEKSILTAKFNWLICLLNSVIIGLMTIIFFNVNLSKIMSSIEGFQRNLIGFSNTSNADLNLPHFKIIAFMVIMSIISNIIIVVLEKIFFGIFCRNKSKISKYFSIQMVLYTIFSVSYVASIVCSFASLKLFFIIFVLGLVMDVVVLVQLMLGEKSTKKNVLAIVTPIYVVISIIAVIFILILGLSTVMYSYNASNATINSVQDSMSGYDSFNW